MDTNRCRVRTPIGRSPLRWTAYYIFRAARVARGRREGSFSRTALISRAFPPSRRRRTISGRLRAYIAEKDYVISRETEIYRSAAIAVNVRTVSPSYILPIRCVAYDRHFWDCYRYNVPRLFHAPPFPTSSPVFPAPLNSATVWRILYKMLVTGFASCPLVRRYLNVYAKAGSGRTRNVEEMEKRH